MLEGDDMNRFEKFKTMTPEAVASEMCFDYDQKGNGCYHCPVFERCRTGHNGFLDYLTEEIVELENKS